jgi:hypothetical protein
VRHVTHMLRTHRCVLSGRQSLCSYVLSVRPGLGSFGCYFLVNHHHHHLPPNLLTPHLLTPHLSSPLLTSSLPTASLPSYTVTTSFLPEYSLLIYPAYTSALPQYHCPPPQSPLCYSSPPHSSPKHASPPYSPPTQSLPSHSPPANSHRAPSPYFEHGPDPECIDMDTTHLGKHGAENVYGTFTAQRLLLAVLLLLSILIACTVVSRDKIVHSQCSTCYWRR